MNLEIITHKEDNREDTVFYYDKDIAKVEIPNGKKLYLESRGELEILTDNGKVKGINALEWLKDNSFNDTTLNELYDEDKVLLSNWFVIVEVDINGETISDDLVLDGTYTEALDNIKVAYNDFYVKNYNCI